MEKKVTTYKKKKIDGIDCKMIELLQKDGRISNTEIAKKIGISSQSINYRIKNLLKKNAIQAFRVRINLPKIGMQNCSIEIYLKDHSKRKSIIEYLERSPYFEYNNDMTIGWSDISLEFMVENVNQLTEIIEDVDLKFPGAIRKTNFWISKEVHKERWLPELY